jgi:putative DNA primase/helicase
VAAAIAKHKEAEAEAEPEPEDEAAAEAPGTLDPKAPRDTAKKLLALRYWHKPEDCQRLIYWQKQYWQWTGQHWQVLDSDTMRAKVYDFLDAAQIVIRNQVVARFQPDRDAVSKVMDALMSVVNFAPENQMPAWLKGKAPVENLKELVACQNGLLDVRTRSLVLHTPKFWSPNVLEFDFNPRARAPRFEQFLEELWPGDSEAQQSVLEMIGLCITDETKYQKAWMFVGPKRGGRGTLGRLIQGLIGRENYLGTNMHSFGGDFGMAEFIGKKVVVFSDARLDGLRRKELSIIAEHLLNTTGEDPQSISRKYLGKWIGTLTCRLLIFSNELLRFQEETGALTGRFITNQMTQTFWGREDPDLTRKLLAERSGILNLALDALDQLRLRGKPLQPASGLQMAEDLENLGSDILAFVKDRLVLDPNLHVILDQLFSAWNAWCLERKTPHGWGLEQFSQKLRAACPSVTSSRPRVNNPRRLTTLYGIGLRPSVRVASVRVVASGGIRRI